MADVKTHTLFFVVVLEIRNTITVNVNEPRIA